MATIKIAKFISEAGIASRRKAQILIEQGLIFVNGKVLNDPARRINPLVDKVAYLGKPVTAAALVYYLLNKPVGYTSTTEDPHARELVTALVPKDPKVWPVGRLDKFTSGMIVLTNDGELTQRLTHPKFEIQKEYEIITNVPLNSAEISQIQRGMRLEDGFVKPDRFEALGAKIYRITLHSGKKRVVRRIIENTGKAVAQLKRIRIGSLTLGTLHPAKWRRLDSKDIARLTVPVKH